MLKLSYLISLHIFIVFVWARNLPNSIRSDTYLRSSNVNHAVLSMITGKSS